MPTNSDDVRSSAGLDRKWPAHALSDRLNCLPPRCPWHPFGDCGFTQSPGRASTSERRSIRAESDERARQKYAAPLEAAAATSLRRLFRFPKFRQLLFADLERKS